MANTIKKKLLIKSFDEKRLDLLMKEVERMAEMEYANFHSQLAFNKGAQFLRSLIAKKYGIWVAKEK